VEVKDYSRYNLVEPVVKPVNMSREELNGYLLESFRKFYMDKLFRIEEMSPFKKKVLFNIVWVISLLRICRQT